MSWSFHFQGDQCEKCKPNFVGDPVNNVQCVPCSTYCHGHTSICTSDVDAAPTSRDVGGLAEPEEYRDIYRDISAATKARCARCANNTDGPRCEKCIEGYFRGTDDYRDPCRPWVCFYYWCIKTTIVGKISFVRRRLCLVVDYWRLVMMIILNLKSTAYVVLCNTIYIPSSSKYLFNRL